MRAEKLGYFGTETEWSTQFLFDDSVQQWHLPEGLKLDDYRSIPLDSPRRFITVDDKWSGRRFMSGILEDYPIPGVGRFNNFLENGRKLYIDCHHFESATDVKHSARNLAVTEDSDEMVLHDILQSVVDDLRNPVIGFQLNKRCIDYNGNSWGYHESHITDREVMNPLQAHNEHLRQFLTLGLHFATRGLYAGAGGLVKTYDEVTGLPTLTMGNSQKISSLTMAFSQFTTDDFKPLVNTRDSYYAADNYARLHVVSGDPTISHWSTVLKVGTTKLIIGALHAGQKLRNMPQFTPNKLHLFAKQANLDPLGKTLLHGEGGSISALDIQWELLAMVKRYLGERRCASQDPTDEDAFVVQQWEYALQKIQQATPERPPDLADRADNAMRRKMLGTLAGKASLVHELPDGRLEPQWSHAKMISADAKFDRVSRDKPDERSVPERLRQKEFRQWLPGGHEEYQRRVQQERAQPGSDTASTAVRARAVGALARATLPELVDAKITWNAVQYNQWYRSSNTYTMDHPADGAPEGLDALLDSLIDS